MMNVAETVKVSAELRRAGFEISMTVLAGDDSTVCVFDPAQCSSGGGKRWVENDLVTLRSASQARRFLAARA